ncbi:hypothetical protein ACHAW6_005802 [Cyclotella cf. meneghiniana]
MPSPESSRGRRWITVVIPLALLLLSLDDLLTPRHIPMEHRRRVLEEGGEGDSNDSALAVQAAALAALDSALSVLDQAVAARNPITDQHESKNATSEPQLVEAAEKVASEAQVQEALQVLGQPVQATSQQEAIGEHVQEQQESTTSIVDSAVNRRDEPPPPPIQTREKYFGKIFPETNHVDMPFYLRNTFEPAPLHEEDRDIIFFWHIPKTGGQLVKNVMGMCFGLRRAEKLKDPASLEMVHDVIVNVDTSSPEGIAEAHDLGLIDSNMVDFITSSFVLSASSLFTPQHRGRAFTILRHPIDAAASNFYTRKVKHPDLRGKYTLAQYAAKNYYIDNWVTRQLTGTLPHEELTQTHIDRAKNILAAKFFVGIYEHMDETMRQLKAFYKWKALPDQEYCVTDLIHGSNPKFQKTWRGKPARGSNDWAFVANVEKWDMELYYFGLEVFSKQGRIWDADEYSLVETGRGR